MKHFKGLIGVLLVAILLAACAPAAAPTSSSPESTAASQPAAPAKAVDTNRVVNIAYTAICKNFDNTTNLGLAEQACINQVYDSLLYRDFEGKIQPNLAKEWKVSDDGLIYTFSLRDDVKWSDGQPFTAEDVKASFDYYKTRPGVSWFFAEHIKETKVVNPYTVEVILNKPNAPFLVSMGLPQYGFIMAKHVLDKYGDKIGATMESIVGTGPYVVTDWKTDVSVTFKAKEDYWKGPVDVKNLVLHKIPDMNSAVVALQTGELDVYYNPVKGTAYETLSKAPKVKIAEFLSARNEAVYMYCKSGMFADLRMRQAVAYALSKEEALTVAAEGRGVPVQYPGDIGTRMAGNPDIKPSITYNQDLEKAKALVKEAGMEGAKIVVKSYNTEPYATLGTYIQNVLVKIGLNATAEQMERATFLDQLEKEEIMIMPFTWVGSTYDIDEILLTAVYSKNVGSSANYSYYIDPEMDKLVDASRAETDAAARLKINQQIIEKFMKDVPFVTLYAVQYAIPHSAELTMENPQLLSAYQLKWVK
ncbi:MAG: ABC transporter substrate-binding protein [Anaerolineaceae bacterium]|nr:ABC transporter substrate-binding protein [Anaerolineaceae bacterium]